MKKLYFSISFLVLFILPSLCLANEASHEKLLELARVTGIYEQIEESKKSIAAQGEKLGRQLEDQIIAQFSEMPPELTLVFHKEFEQYMTTIADFIDAETVVNSYMELISPKLSADEVDAIISFYNSEIGKKYSQSNIEITSEWSASMYEGVDTKIAAALQVFMQNFSAAVQEHQQTMRNKEQ
ncbi:MAG: DUF2059 domain-containing protein [Desulfuromonadales bacterium]|nr:DUF2059 domain-containing protein [Desulfuromonadales bacterium]